MHSRVAVDNNIKAPTARRIRFTAYSNIVQHMAVTGDRDETLRRTNGGEKRTCQHLQDERKSITVSSETYNAENFSFVSGVKRKKLLFRSFMITLMYSGTIA